MTKIYEILRQKAFYHIKTFVNTNFFIHIIINRKLSMYLHSPYKYLALKLKKVKIFTNWEYLIKAFLNVTKKYTVDFIARIIYMNYKHIIKSFKPSVWQCYCPFSFYLKSKKDNIEAQILGYISVSLLKHTNPNSYFVSQTHYILHFSFIIYKL